MGAKRQQGTEYQPYLFRDMEDPVRPGVRGEGRTGASGYGERQTSTASEQDRALTQNLMEEVCKRDNLNRAYKRVKSNRGAPLVWTG